MGLFQSRIARKTAVVNVCKIDGCKLALAGVAKDDTLEAAAILAELSSKPIKVSGAKVAFSDGGADDSRTPVVEVAQEELAQDIRDYAVSLKPAPKKGRAQTAPSTNGSIPATVSP